MPTAADTFTADDLNRLRRDCPKVRVIDVRSPAEFVVRHIPGSYNVPLPLLAEHRDELVSSEAGPVVLVCESGGRAGVAERRLARAGLASVHVLTGGVAGWEARGLELIREPAATAPWAIERQVRLVAGAIVTAAVGVSFMWLPARFVAGAIGAGLVVAALTNTCAMGGALARLPYNTRSRATCDLAGVVETITGTGEARS